MAQRNPIATLGHSTLTSRELLDILRKHHTGTLVDVRSTPYSRHVPQYNRETIRQFLEGAGIDYVYLGGSLGGRPSRNDLLTAEGRADYDLMAREPAFPKALERVERLADAGLVALMCTEADPLQCHRTLLVASELHGRGNSLLHLLRNGRQETHGELMQRLMAMWDLSPENHPGVPREELALEAARRQAARVAWKRP